MKTEKDHCKLIIDMTVDAARGGLDDSEGTRSANILLQHPISTVRSALLEAYTASDCCRSMSANTTLQVKHVTHKYTKECSVTVTLRVRVHDSR